MSSGKQGNARNLNKSRMQALNAIVSSLSSEDKGGISKEYLNKKLDDVLGEKGGVDNATNSSGEILNEEGLPIIDISEPAEHAATQTRIVESSTTINDPVPLAMLSADERLKRKAQQERILAMLEEEEEREAQKQAEKEEREARDFVERAKADARKETERKKAAREMQRKMGKALMSSLGDSRKEEAIPPPTKDIQMSGKTDITGSGGKPKKSVKFNVDTDTKPDDSKPSGTAGDVSFAPLRASTSSIRPKSANVDGLTMKMNVVERTSQKKTALPESSGRVVDSDDESDDDAEGCAVSSISSVNAPSDEEDTGSVSLEGSDDDVDMSQAQLQREAALEYFRLRESMGKDFAQALSSSQREGDVNDPWNQPEVPLEATLATDRPKPSVSRFKASRQGRSDGKADGVSIAGFTVSNAEAQTVQRAVRNGKLQDGKLVGGKDGESASEDEDAREATRQVIELLTRGDPAEIAAALEKASITTPDDASNTLGTSRNALSSTNPSTLNSQLSDDAIRLTSVVDNENINNQSIHTFRNPPTAIPVPRAPPSARTPSNVSSQVGHANVPVPDGSPSFPPGSNPGVPSFPSMVIESPSFPRRNVGQANSRANPVMSNVVERGKVPAIPPKSDSTPSSSSKPRVSRFKAERT